MYKLRNVVKAKKSEVKNFRLEINDLELPEGYVISIIGSSGSGKTTLLNILSGLDNYDSGEVLFYKDLLSSKKRNFSFVFQHGYLLNNATVSVNMSLFANINNLVLTSNDLTDMCKKLGLTPPEYYLHKRAWELSGGEMQRVGVARALLANPDCIFADEASSNLDPILGGRLIQTLSNWCKTHHKSMFWVTHHYEQAKKYSDFFLAIKNGLLLELDGEKLIPNCDNNLEKIVRNLV